MRKNQFRAFAGVAALSLCLGLGAAAMPATSTKAATEHWNDASETDAAASWKKYKNQWTSISTNYENVSITPGADETQLNFAWYSKVDSRKSETAKVKIVYGKKAKNNKIVPGKSELIEKKTVDEDGVANGVADDVDGKYYSNKVTVTDLKPNTDYYYQVCTGQNEKGEDVWSDMQKVSTKDTDEFSFLYVGDPQIGASSGQTDSENTVMGGTKGDPNNFNARNDAYNWNKVLKGAVKNHPDVSFMVSAGDQVNSATSEAEYAGYLSAEVLASLPVATTIGNHDSSSKQYSYHYNNPNVDKMDATGAKEAGTDYYYRYGNTLFIVIDTNNYNCGTHEKNIKTAIENNKDAKWRVVTFHQDIYGSGYDHSDSDGIVLRTQLTPIFDEYDIDVVLQGHDHTYSRTYQLTSDGEEHNHEVAMNSGHENFLAENDCYEIKSDVKGGTITNPEGTVYYEANSATGSKFYNLIPVQQNYIAERSQTWTPTYSVVNVTDDTFSVTTYDATTQEPVAGSSTYTIKKTDGSEDQGNQDQGGQNQDQNQDGQNQDQNQNQQAPQTQQPTVNNNAQTPAAAVAAAPAKVKGVKVSNKAGNKIKVKWNTQEGVTGYQIQYTYKKGFTKKVKTVNVNKASKASKVIKKMKVGKKVYVKVRAYQNVNGQNVYGNFSKVKKLTVR